jgi:hypothetical protein
METFTIKGDMTGAWADEGQKEEVMLQGIADEMKAIGCPQVDLLKINIEGGEYELLEAILNLNLAPYFKYIQVQFHGITQLNPVERRDAIRAGLNKTHECAYNADFCWEGWTRK